MFASPGPCLRHRLALVLTSLAISPIVVLADERAPVTSATPPSPVRAFFEEAAAANQVSVVGDEGATSEPRIALRWANNTRGTETGMTVLYVVRGVPVAACCMYPWRDQLSQEIDSVARGPLELRQNGELKWKPATPGIEFAPIAGAETPATTRPARLRQIKQLASRFTSTLLRWKDDSSDRETLRMLPQPLYRYEPQPGNLIEDGAVFAFVQGTDPESLLLIESHRVDGAARWEFGFVRRTTGEVDGRLDGKIVWHVDPNPPADDPAGIHVSLSRPLPPDVVRELQSP